MLKKKNSKTMRFLYQLTATILIMIILVSCGRNTPSGGDKPENEGKPGVTEQQNKQQDSDKKSEKENDSGKYVTPATAAQSYSQFLEAKSNMVTRLTDALANNPDTGLTSLSFMGLALVDLAMLPATSFGLGDQAAASALGLFGFQDVVYSENGDQYSVKYKNAEGTPCELKGEYNKAADALKCTGLIEGKEELVYEYCKTSFGYVGQIYTIKDDGTSYVYQIAVSGKDGVVGMADATENPESLTGNESIEFPKQCPEWYSIKGDEVTGLTSDGENISFTYTPTEETE